MDIVELDRVAVEESLRVVGLAQPGQWELATPCGAWTLRQLVSHMTAHHRGFAASAKGVRDDMSVWQDVSLGGDPRDVYEESARRALDAFGEPGVQERQFWLPGIPGSDTFPGRTAVAFHFLDYVVHAWDVAAVLGTTPELPGPVVEVALGIAEQVPGGDYRLGPDAVFAPAVEAPEGAPPLDRVVALLGRSPRWSAGVPRT